MPNERTTVFLLSVTVLVSRRNNAIHVWILTSLPTTVVYTTSNRTWTGYNIFMYLYKYVFIRVFIYKALKYCSVLKQILICNFLWQICVALTLTKIPIVNSTAFPLWQTRLKIIHAIQQQFSLIADWNQRHIRYATISLLYSLSKLLL